MKAIDLNSDLGEGYGPWQMGDDEAILEVVTSVNIACGGHAGDPETMYKTLKAAHERGINIGAHPGFPDKQGFGRRHIPYSPPEIERIVAGQIGALSAIAALAGASVRYVKPHGALGNLAAADQDIADAILHAISAVDESLAVLAMSGTTMERRARDRSLTTYSEVFADRAYSDSGDLVPRGRPGAMVHDPGEATNRMVTFLETGQMPTVTGAVVLLEADSICVHGDSPSALATAQLLRAKLESDGKLIQSFVTPRTG